jgi:hypothetical protein
MSRKAKTKRQLKNTGKNTRNRPGRNKAPHKSKRNRQKGTRPIARPRKSATARQKSRSTKRKSKVDRRLEIAVREMNRGRSLNAAARTVGLSSKHLQQQLKRKRLIRRKGSRWVAADNRLRRVPVMTGGRSRALTVRGFKPAHFIGKHHHAVREFIRSNDLELLKPFEGQTVQAANGRHYALETDANALHRLASLDEPVFHEIYRIVS